MTRHLAVCLFLLCWSATLAAGAPDRARVVHVRDATAEEQEPGLVAQLTAELRAVGFDVREARLAESDDAASLHQAASESGSIAAIAVSRTGDTLTARVWLTDRTTQRESLQLVRVSADVAEPIRVLALRVAELLYASSLELSLKTQDEAVDTNPPAVPPEHGASHDAATPQETRNDPAAARSSANADALPVVARREPGVDHGTASVNREPADAPARYGIAIGATALGGPGGIGVAVAPALLASWRALPEIAAELYATGPALGTVRDEIGSVSFDQEIVAVRMRYEPIYSSWSPFVSAGAGAYRIGARGTADEPFRGTSDSALSVAGVAAAGVRFVPSRSLALLGEADVLFVTPRPALRFADERIARTGLPLFALTLCAELGW